MKSPVVKDLEPIKRREYKPSDTLRMNQERAQQAEPKVRSLSTSVQPSSRLIYGNERS